MSRGGTETVRLSHIFIYILCEHYFETAHHSELTKKHKTGMGIRRATPAPAPLPHNAFHPAELNYLQPTTKKIPILSHFLFFYSPSVPVLGL